MTQRLLGVYHRLLTCYGPQHWWPADSPFEVIIGAILTQSTSWTNVEKAIINLKAKDALSPDALRQMPEQELAQLVYPAGYYNAKAKKIKSFVQWLGDNYNDDLNTLFAPPIPLLRQRLLFVHGIGEETADSIILYAAGKASFVIDAYTRRIVSRLSLEPATNSYAAFQELFVKHIPHDGPFFNEYHALFVRHGKTACKRTPLCQGCCLNYLCKFPEKQGV